MSTESLPRRAYSVAEVAAMFGVSKDVIYDLLNAGQMRYVRMGSLKRIPVEEIPAFEQRNRT